MQEYDLPIDFIKEYKLLEVERVRQMSSREKELINKARRLKKVYQSFAELVKDHGVPEKFIIESDGKQYDITEGIYNSIFTSRRALEFLTKEGLYKTNNNAVDADNLSKIESLIENNLRLVFEQKPEDKNLLRYDDKMYLFAQCIQIICDIDINQLYALYICDGINEIAIKSDSKSYILGTYKIQLVAAMYFPIKAGLTSCFNDMDMLTFNELPSDTDQLTWEQYIAWLNEMGINGDTVDSYIKAFAVDSNTEDFKKFIRSLNSDALYINTGMQPANNKDDKSQDWNAAEEIKDIPYVLDIQHICSEIEDISDYIVYLRTVKIGNTTFEFDVTRAFVEWVAVACGDKSIVISELLKPIVLFIPELLKLVDGLFGLAQGAESDRKAELDKMTEQAKKNKDAYREMRSQIKRLKAELEETKQKLNSQVNKNVKQDVFIQKLKEQGVADVTPIKAELEKSRQLTEKYREELESARRQISKASKQVKELSEQNKRLFNNNDLLASQNKTILDKANSIAETVNGNSIPIGCYIKAIRNRKITIYGGDMIHSELRKLGFRNLKLFEADNRNVSVSDLSHQDLIVMITGYIAHSTSHIPKLASEKYGVPMLYFNNKNINILIQEMFKVFYSEEYDAFRHKRNQEGY